MKRLIGVGVGPGDPELVTVKAIRILREADLVMVPVLPGLPGRAEAIIGAYVDQVRRLEFALDDAGGLTERRTAAWLDAAREIAAEFAAGAGVIAFGTLGDPSLYSTFSYLSQTVRTLVPGVQVETVPGITAMQDLAARAGISLGEGTEPVTLLPLNAGTDALDQALAHGGAVVGYKLGAKASPVQAVLHRLQAAGRLDTAIIGTRLGLPGEHLTPAPALLTPAPPPPHPAAPPPHPAAPRPMSDISLFSPPLDGVTPEKKGSPEGRGTFSIPSSTGGPESSAQSRAATSTTPDIPYLSTLLVPALRQPGTGSSLAAAAASASASAASVTSASASAARGNVTFVGAGPGAADLLTLRGAQVIARADVVIWASSLVHPDVLRHARPAAEVVDSAQLPMEGVLPYYERAAKEGLRVARVHSGDPSLWGAVQEQLERCEELGLATEIVPGVSSFTAVAARIGRELTIPEVAQSVILTRLGGGKTPMPARERVAEFARHGTTMALFLSAARSGQLQDELTSGGYAADTPCVVAYQVTWPDELIVHCALEDLAATIREHKLWKHTLVLVGPGLAAGGSRSHLYHPGHFHGFRKADRLARRKLRESRSQ